VWIVSDQELVVVLPVRPERLLVWLQRRQCFGCAWGGWWRDGIDGWRQESFVKLRVLSVVVIVFPSRGLGSVELLVPRDLARVLRVGFGLSPTAEAIEHGDGSER